MAFDPVQRALGGALAGHQVQPDRPALDARLVEQLLGHRLDRRAPAQVDEEHVLLAGRADRLEVAHDPAPQLLRLGDDPVAVVRVEDDRVDHLVPEPGVVEPAVGVRGQLAEVLERHAESARELPQRRQAAAGEQLLQLLARALDDRRPRAHLARQPQGLGHDRGVARRRRSVDETGEQLALAHEAEGLRHLGDLRAVVRPLGEGGEGRAQAGGPVLPEGPQALGLARALGAAQDLAAQGREAVLAVLEVQLGAAVGRLALHDPRQPRRAAIEVHGADAQPARPDDVGLPVVADVDHLLRSAAQRLEHEREQALPLAGPVRAGGEDPVEALLGERAALQQEPQLALGEVRVRDGDRLLARGVRRAHELEDVEIGNEQIALHLAFDLGQLDRRHRTGQERLGHRGVDLLERDLDALSAGASLLAGALLGRAAQRRPLGVVHARVQRPARAQARGDQVERLARLGDLAPQHGVEHVEREDGDLVRLDEGERLGEPRIGDRERLVGVGGGGVGHRITAMQSRRGAGRRARTPCGGRGDRPRPSTTVATAT